MDISEESALVESLLEHDEDALRRAIDEFGGLVLGMAKRIVVDAAVAEEVAQDVFLTLWRRPGAFIPERGTLQTFLVRIARNKAVDRVRREEAFRRTKEELVLEAATSKNPPSNEPGETVDIREQVRDALIKLSPLQREAIVLAYFGGRTYREVASELGIPEGTAKTRLRDGLNKLRELMATTRQR